MTERLDGCRVAILVTDGFEEVELTKPRQALDDAGADRRRLRRLLLLGGRRTF